VLGNGSAFYTQAGKNHYALIQNWDPKSSTGDPEFDHIQLAGNISQYKVEFSSISGIGSNAQDTETLYKLNNNWERIGIIQDSTNVNLSRDAVFP
jgi:hypothetical protein